MRELDPPGNVNSVDIWLDWMRIHLKDQPRRFAHGRRVWLRAKDLARSPNWPLSKNAGDALEMAALLHDVGRALDPRDTTPHAFLGAEYLRSLGLERVANLVAFHSGAAIEARERCGSEPLGWVREATNLPSLLT